MKHSYLLAGTRFSRFIRLLIRNRAVVINPKYWGRIIFLLQNAVWASIFAWKEKQKMSSAIANQKTPDNPVFIIGHWRTGSTHLHKLMSLDSQFHAPSVFQVSLPDSLLFSERYYQPIMEKFMGKTRPMDNMKLSPTEPQEDEYAILKQSACSPLEDLIFPKSKAFFLKDYTDYIPENEKLKKQFIKVFETFCKKLTLISNNKQLLFKNPFHTLRLPLLLEMFPNARFIYITRNPLDVIPSSQHMWNIVGRQNCLKKEFVKPDVREICQIVLQFYKTVEKFKNLIKKDYFTQITYEDLEKSPVEELKRVYSELHIDFTSEYEDRVNNYLNTISNYKKNSYLLDQEQLELVNNIFKEYIS